MAVSADNDAASMRSPSAGRLVVFGSQIFWEFKSVEAAGRSMKEIRFLPRPRSARQPLASIPKRCVGIRGLVDGKAALEHAASRAETRNARLHVGPPDLGQHYGARRFGQRMEAQSADPLRHATN